MVLTYDGLVAEVLQAQAKRVALQPSLDDVVEGKTTPSFERARLAERTARALLANTTGHQHAQLAWRKRVAARGKRPPIPPSPSAA